MPKRPVGRPPDTINSLIEKGKLPENWKEVIFSMAADGCSDVEIRAKLMISAGMNPKAIEGVWYALKEKEEEFSRTIIIAKQLCEAWWVAKGRDCLKAKNFQAFVWFCNMKNRFGWKDKTDIEMETHEYKHADFQSKTPEEIRKLAHDLAVDITRERVTSSQN